MAAILPLLATTHPGSILDRPDVQAPDEASPQQCQAARMLRDRGDDSQAIADLPGMNRATYVRALQDFLALEPGASPVDEARSAVSGGGDRRDFDLVLLVVPPRVP